MCDKQGKQAIKKAIKVTVNKNKNTSGRGSATKTRKRILHGRHLGYSSNNITLPPRDELQLCDHCHRMDDYETDSYFNSYLTKKYSRRLPIRIAWSPNNTQYNSNFICDGPSRTMVIFLDDGDTRKMSGSHAGQGQQCSQSLPLATSRSKATDRIQDGNLKSMLWEVGQDPGVGELCRVECKAQHNEKTLVAAHEAGRQTSRSAIGAQIEQRLGGSLKNNAKKMAPILKVEPQQSQKTTSVAERAQQSEKSLVAAYDTACLPDSHSVIGQRSIPTPLVHLSNLNVSCKVRIAHKPSISAEKPSLQSAKGLVAHSEAGKQDSGAATGAQKKQAMVVSFQNSEITPTIRSSATALVQPTVAKLLVPVSNSGVYFSGEKPKKPSLQSKISSVTQCESGWENSGAGAQMEQPMSDSFVNNATQVTPVVGSASTTPLEKSMARLPVPFPNSLSFGKEPKPTNNTSVGKPSQQSKKSLLAASDASALPNSHSLISQSSVPSVLVNSANLNLNCKVLITREPGISVEKSSWQSKKSSVTPYEAGRQGIGAGNEAQKEHTTGGSRKNSVRKVTPCLWWSAVTIPTHTSSAKLHVAESNSGDHASGTKPEQINQTKSVDKPCQQSEKSPVTARHTGHFRDSCSLIGQSSIPPTFVPLSDLNVTCKVQIAHEPDSCVDKQSQQSKKNLVTAHEARKQNSGAAVRAQREQPMGGSLKKSIQKVTPCLWWSATTAPVHALADTSFVSVSKSGVHSSGTKTERTNNTTPVEISASMLPVPFSNSHASFATKPDQKNDSIFVDKPSQQSEKSLAVESDASGLPVGHGLISQSSNLNVSCKVRIAHEPGTSVNKPPHQSDKNSFVARKASRQNSAAATASQSKQPAEDSLENSAKKVTPYRWWSADTTPAQPLEARLLVSGSNFGGHPSGTRLEQTNKTTSMDNPSQQIEKIPVTACDTGCFPGSRSPTVFKLSSNPNVSCNVQITYKPPYSVDKVSQQSEKSLVAVHEASGQSSDAAFGAQREQPTDGSLLSVSNLNNKPDTKPEQTIKTTSVDAPSWQSEKSSVAGLDTSLIGQSSIPTAFMQSSDLNDRCKVRIARQPGYVRKGQSGRCLASSAQGKKPSEVKELHRYAAYLN